MRLSIHRNIQVDGLSKESRSTFFSFFHGENLNDVVCIRVVWYPKSRAWSVQYRLNEIFIASDFGRCRKTAIGNIRKEIRMKTDPEFKRVCERLLV